jgi:hypothetical protein
MFSLCRRPRHSICSASWPIGPAFNRGTEGRGIVPTEGDRATESSYAQYGRLLTAAACGYGFARESERYLTALPKDLKLKERSPQQYRFTCDYFQVTPTGDLIRKQRVAAEYARALPGGKVRWSNVTVAEATGYGDAFPAGEKQPYMEGLSYQLSETRNMLKPEFFAGFPSSPTALLAKNLVWDTHMIEQFGQNHLADLKLNQTHRLQSKPEDVPLAGAGTFQNRQIELTWIGLSRRNGELCALIQYRAFLNKLDISMGPTQFKGKSSYWGEIWVSLEDKQIEHSTLYEDVLLEMPDPRGPKLITIFRQGTLEKRIR